MGPPNHFAAIFALWQGNISMLKEFTASGNTFSTKGYTGPPTVLRDMTIGGTSQNDIIMDGRTQDLSAEHCLKLTLHLSVDPDAMGFPDSTPLAIHVM